MVSFCGFCRQYAERCLVVGSFQVMSDDNVTTVQSCQRLVLIAFDVSVCPCGAVKRETSPNDFTRKTCSFTAVLKAVVAISEMFFKLVSEPTVTRRSRGRTLQRALRQNQVFVATILNVCLL